MLEESFSISNNIFNLETNNDNSNDNNLLSIHTHGVFLSDGGANVVIIRDEGLFCKSKFKRLLRYININGVGSAKLACEGVGKLKVPFDYLTGLFVPSFKANIIGQYAARLNKYTISQTNSIDPKDDIETYSFEGKPVALFHRGKENLFIFKSPVVDHVVFTMITSSVNTDNNLELGSVELKEVKFIQAELMKQGLDSKQIAMLFRVHELHKRLGFMSILKMQYLVANNLVKNLDKVVGPITEKHLIMYAKYLHPLICNGCHGKLLAERSVALDPIFAVSSTSKAHGDFFYITAERLGLPNLKYNFLLFIDERTRYFLVFTLINDKEEEIRKAVQALCSAYSSFGHTLTMIRFDNAKAFGENSKLSEWLKTMGLKIESCDPERHVRLVEAAIGYLKRYFKGIVTSLSYKLSPKLYKYAILDAVNKINLGPNKSNHYKSPVELFTGRQPDAIDIRFNFGELVHFHKTGKSSLSSDSSNVGTGFVMGRRDASRSGALWLYDINKDIIIAKHQVLKFAGSDAERSNLYDRMSKVSNGDKYMLVREEESESEAEHIDHIFESKAKQSKSISNAVDMEVPSNKLVESDEIQESRSTVESDDTTTSNKEASTTEKDNTMNESGANDVEEVVVEEVASTDEITDKTEASSSKEDGSWAERAENIVVTNKSIKRPYEETFERGVTETIDHIEDSNINSGSSTGGNSNTNNYHRREGLRYNPRKTSPHLYPCVQLEGVPHKCQLVGVPDKCQLVGVPDKCQLVGVPDKCQLVGVPDKCQLVGVPDNSSKGGGGPSNDTEEDDILKYLKLTPDLMQIVDIFTSIMTFRRDFGVVDTDNAILVEVLQMISTKSFKFYSKDDWKRLNRLSFKKVLPSTLVLKAKYNSDNEFVKIKARLVVLGNLQTIYDNILNRSSIEAPTVALSSVLIILSIVAKKKLKFATFDIKGAFLHAPMRKGEEVFVRISKEVAKLLVKQDVTYEKFLQEDGTFVVQLNKCLYGLRQSPRAWYDLISGVIMKLGYTKVDNDSCLYVKHTSEESSYILLYVDDMAVAGTDTAIKEFHEGLVSEFDNDNVTAYLTGSKFDFLGMRIETDNDWVRVSQSAYIENICDIEEDPELDLSKNFSSPHPSTFTQDRSKDTSPKSDEINYFRRKVMQCMYAAVRTRPDILLDIVVLAGRLDNPTKNDLSVLRRILSYLYSTRHEGLMFRDGDWDFWAAVDASFNSYENGRGHSGILMFLDWLSAAILAKSLKQKIVSSSSTQSELICLNEGILHILWLAGTLTQLLPGVQIYPIKIFNDNQPMITLVKQPVVNRQGRSKFMSRALFKANEHLEAGEIILLYENTESLVADFLTKAVHGSKFKSFKAKIMGLNDKERIIHLNDFQGGVDEALAFFVRGERLGKLKISWLECSY